MLNHSNKQKAFRESKTHRYATLWRIERTDGVILRFTNHNAPIVFTGETFVPMGGVTASARQKQEGLRSNNLELVGIINDDQITHDDIRAGKYREAKVTEKLVDWRYPWADSALYIAQYWINEISFDGIRWNAQVASVSRKLRAFVGDLVTRNCRHDLGDSLCGINLASHTVSATITAVDTQRLVFRASGLASKPNDFYNFGLVTFTSGANSGLSAEVKDWTDTGRIVELQLKLPFNFTIGDAFDIYPGCDKTIESCKGTSGTANKPWSTNIVNFGGFPHVPGNEKLYDTPNAI